MCIDNTYSVHLSPDTVGCFGGLRECGRAGQLSRVLATVEPVARCRIWFQVDKGLCVGDELAPHAVRAPFGVVNAERHRGGREHVRSAFRQG